MFIRLDLEATASNLHSVALLHPFLVVHRISFQANVRTCTTTVEKERDLFRELAGQVKEMEAKLQGGQVTVMVLEFFSLHMACDDPGEKLAMPMLKLLRERLVAGARQHAVNQAERAQQEILAMEEVGAAPGISIIDPVRKARCRCLTFCSLSF